MFEGLALNLQEWLIKADHNVITVIVMMAVVLLLIMRFRARHRHRQQNLHELRRIHDRERQKDPDQIVDAAPSVRKARLTIILSTAIILLLIYIGLNS